MAPKEKRFQGFKKIDTSIPFLSFKEPGEFVEGVFIEANVLTSKEYGQEQTVWTVQVRKTDIPLKGGIIPAEGDFVRIAEKAAMTAFRLQLQKGELFAIEYLGEEPSKTKGRRPFKNFDFYKSEE